MARSKRTATTRAKRHTRAAAANQPTGPVTPAVVATARKIVAAADAHVPAIEGEINLGDRVRHKVSKWTGVVEAITVWRNGCVRVQADADRTKPDGDLLDAKVFDLNELELLAKAIITPHMPFTYPTYPVVFLSSEFERASAPALARPPQRGGPTDRHPASVPALPPPHHDPADFIPNRFGVVR